MTTNTEELIEMCRQTRVALTDDRDDKGVIRSGARQSMAFLARIESELRNSDTQTVERDEARAQLARVTAERDELRAIVEGRKVAPTDAELTAHDANGARWLVKLDGGKNTAMVVEVMAWPSSREWLLARGASRWWPIDANGPCAWPKVTP